GSNPSECAIKIEKPTLAVGFSIYSSEKIEPLKVRQTPAGVWSKRQSGAALQGLKSHNKK
ncbi:MAG: hypothetical protein KDI24_13560, partial [Pseudomonadales bacterium]|nr:hypothetical protein [Pseudomonadales bacterium]